MNIGIIGGGSTGLLLSAYLSENHTVTLYVHRKEQKEKIHNKQLHLFTYSKYDRTVSISVKLITELQQEDCLIICVKQPHIEHVLSYFKNISDTTPLFFLQNGMGHLELIKELPQPVYVGVIEHGASRLSDYEVNHLGAGVIKLASFTGTQTKLQLLIQELHTNEFPFEQIGNWRSLLFDKLIINAVINPLTALFNIPNGSIIENKSIKFLAENLCKEAADVLQVDFKTAWKRIVQTANNTRENTSSMRADILKRDKTEIEAISGYILKQVDSNEIPYTSFIYHSILALEKEGELYG